MQSSGRDNGALNKDSLNFLQTNNKRSNMQKYSTVVKKLVKAVTYKVLTVKQAYTLTCAVFCRQHEEMLHY